MKKLNVCSSEINLDIVLFFERDAATISVLDGGLDHARSCHFSGLPVSTKIVPSLMNN